MVPLPINYRPARKQGIVYVLNTFASGTVWECSLRTTVKSSVVVLRTERQANDVAVRVSPAYWNHTLSSRPAPSSPRLLFRCPEDLLAALNSAENVGEPMAGGRHVSILPANGNINGVLCLTPFQLLALWML